MPGREFNSEPHVGDPVLRARFCHLDGARSMHHPMLDGKVRFGVAVRANGEYGTDPPLQW